MKKSIILSLFLSYISIFAISQERQQISLNDEWIIRSLGDNLELYSEDFVKDVKLHFINTSGAVFSDNFFNLLPGKKKNVNIFNSQNGNELQAGDRELESDEI